MWQVRGKLQSRIPFLSVFTQWSCLPHPFSSIDDRETSGRNGPEKLFSTIALDLTGLSEGLAQAIDLALEQQRSLPSAAFHQPRYLVNLKNSF
jgi:hypothetical protein